VSCVTAGDCWAVGETQDNAAVADHWNGSAWSVLRLPAPQGAATTELPSVSCPVAASCWAVGDYESVTTSKQLPYAEHWNGTTWSVTPGPTSGPNDDELSSIACAGRDCLAVGDTGSRTLAEYWNGSAWTVTPTGNADALFGGLSCTAGPRCVATGNTIPGRVFSEVWHGTAWRIVRPAPIGSGGAALAGVSCVSASDCWSVGSRFNGVDVFSLIEHWNGTAWSIAG
jgi:hypothetical protein